MKKIKKILLAVLSVFIFLFTTNMHTTYANNSTDKLILNSDSTTITIKDVNSKIILKVVNNKSKITYLYTISQDKIFIKAFDKNNNLIKSEDLTSATVAYNFSVISPKLVLKARSPISWGKVVKTNWPFKQTLWYQMGHRNKTTYMRIGCKARYTINYNDLSNWQIRRCEWYSKSIRLCNKYYQQLLGKLISADALALAVALAFSLLSNGAALAVIAPALTAAFKIPGEVADLVAKATNEYADADYFYDIIKVWA